MNLDVLSIVRSNHETAIFDIPTLLKSIGSRAFPDPVTSSDMDPS